MKHKAAVGYGSLDRVVEIVASAVRSRDHLIEQVLRSAEREQWKIKVEKVCERLYGKRSEEI